MDFIGLNTEYLCADGITRKRVHLDGAASPLASTVAIEAMSTLLPHYSNSHSYVHSSAQISTRAFAWAQDVVLDYVGADKQEYCAVFIGSGCTASINRLARGLNRRNSEKTTVLVSSMEHHANDLPHRLPGNDVRYLSLTGTGAELGSIDLSKAEKEISELGSKLNYVACSSISNVTGISNDWPKLAAMAHAQGALILIDAAQSIAHQECNFSALESDQRPDFMVFSGHKLYAPMSPGVLVAKRSELRALVGQNLGGGSVADVSLHDFALLDALPDREQTGTPNIVGAFALAAVLKALKDEGLDKIHQREQRLMQRLLKGLRSNPRLLVYGDPALPRLGAISFNHKNIPQGLLAATLNDYFAIAVRNECFCAHPYVSELLKPQLWDLDLEGLSDAQIDELVNQHRGMVRASVSHYTTEEDIDHLIDAINEIEHRLEEFKDLYEARQDGSFWHRTFVLDWQSELSI